SAIRLTVGSYRRPSGKEIHKWKDAKDNDDWGVRPNDGLEVLLTNRQNDLIVAARRKRDLLSWQSISNAAATDSPHETDQRRPNNESTEPSKSNATEEEAAAAASKDPAAIDPQ